ncbi:MAG: hypothetical protein ACYDER_27035 [Ktedonobacteraceae bacterium]
MPKTNKHGSQPPESGTNATNTTNTSKNKTASQTPAADSLQPPSNQNKQSGKSNRSRVGGTAVQGAKSMQPKQMTSNNPQQQQVESYNRQMRRRMEHMGTSPTQNSGMERNRKRMAKRKQRIEERRAEVKKVAASGPRDIRLGRNVVYFLIAVGVIIVALIVIAIVVNHPFR